MREQLQAMLYVLPDEQAVAACVLSKLKVYRHLHIFGKQQALCTRQQDSVRFMLVWYHVTDGMLPVISHGKQSWLSKKECRELTSRMALRSAESLLAACATRTACSAPCAPALNSAEACCIAASRLA